MIRNRRVLSLYRWLRWPLLILGGVGLFLFAAWRLTRPDILQWDDFVGYWAAGRLNAAQQDPYNAEALFALEREVGRPPEEAAPLLIWNPPWVLLLLTPFGMLPYPFARALWFFLQMAALAWSADRLWLIGGGHRDYRLLAWGLAFLFGPALHTLRMGQISHLLLIGLVGFLHFVRRERWIASGITLSLLWIKPHICYLLLGMILLQTLYRRQWALGAGLLGVPLVALLIVALMNPDALTGWLRTLLEGPLKELATPTLGAWLRLFFGVERFWLQFLPSGLAVLFSFGFVLRHRGQDWVNKESLPWWVLFSLLTMPYGWTFDHVVALVALIPTSIRLGWRPQALSWWALWGVYIIVNAILAFTSGNMFWHIWLAPFWLLWTAMALRFARAQAEVI